jgi:hypothetical protein
MSRIFYFPTENKSFNKTLSDLMKEAKNNNSFLENIPMGIITSNFSDLEKIIRISIHSVLINETCCNSDYFHCGTYISKIISDTAKNPPFSFYVIDYLSKIKSKRDILQWQQAANICFLICAIFTGKCNRGLMNYSSYEKMGISLYSTYYSKSKNEIGYLMSDNYKTMVNVTREALKTLSN